MRRLDQAALAMLRDLVDAIASGRAAVVSLQAEAEEEPALAVRWVAGPGVPLEEPAPGAAPAPRGPKPCPACGHAETWLTQHNTLVCPACGHTVIL